MRLLYVFKLNPQDPTEIALRRWFPRIHRETAVFEFLAEEKFRKAEDNDTSVNPRFVEAVEAYRPTHVFSWVPYLNLPELEFLHSRGVKVAAAANGITSFTSGISFDQSRFLDTLRKLDVYFIPHAPHVPLLQAAGVNVMELPFCFDPELFRPARLPRLAGRAINLLGVYIGNFGQGSNRQGAYRASVVSRVAEEGKTLLVTDRTYREHGLVRPGILRMSTVTSQRVLNLLLNSALFSICTDFFPNVEDYHGGKITNVTLRYDAIRDSYVMRPRTFWSLGAGVPIVVERYLDMERLFDCEKEVLAWRNLGELSELVRRYSVDRAALATIANAGRARALEKHSAPVRIREILEVLKGKLK